MNITKENIDELNAVLKVHVGPEDYQNKVEGALKEYQKKANIPGFRPGKVPVGMIKKMYGKSILVDQINKLLSDSLYGYLTENKIEVLGNPLPKRDEHIDWDTQKEFTFSYDLGLAPQFKVELSPKEKFTYYQVKVDDQLIDKYVDDIRRRYGKITNPEIAEENDLLFGEFAELDSEGNILEGGILKNSSIAIDRVKDEELKNKLIGAKKEDKIIVDPLKVSGNAADVAAMLGIDKEKAESLTSNFRFTVFNISRMGLADLNSELYNKVYGPSVNSIEEFRARIKEELSSMFNQDSDRKLKNDIVTTLIEKLNLQLPDEFLKRWLLVANEKPVTMEQVESEYHNYSKGLKWQLIENKIIRDNNLKVERAEAEEFTRNLIKENYAKYNQVAMEEDDLEGTVKRILENEKEAQRLYEKLYDDKLMDYFKSSFTIENKEVTYDEFLQEGKK